jgi:hypothetical protein
MPTKSLDTRLSRLESTARDADNGPPLYVLCDRAELPPLTPETIAAMLADGRAGRMGPAVIIRGRKLTAAEWEAQHGRLDPAMSASEGQSGRAAGII